MTFFEGDFVSVKLNHDLIVTGKVCGEATTGAAVIGKSIIVKLDKPLPDYPFSCIAAFEIQLTRLAQAAKLDDNMVLVHDDGACANGEFHTPLNAAGWCPVCKLYPDMQSTCFIKRS